MENRDLTRIRRAIASLADSSDLTIHIGDVWLEQVGPNRLLKNQVYNGRFGLPSLGEAYLLTNTKYALLLQASDGEPVIGPPPVNQTVTRWIGGGRISWDLLKPLRWRVHDAFRIRMDPERTVAFVTVPLLASTVDGHRVYLKSVDEETNRPLQVQLPNPDWERQWGDYKVSIHWKLETEVFDKGIPWWEKWTNFGPLYYQGYKPIQWPNWSGLLGCVDSDGHPIGVAHARWAHLHPPVFVSQSGEEEVVDLLPLEDDETWVSVIWFPDHPAQSKS